MPNGKIMYQKSLNLKKEIIYIILYYIGCADNNIKYKIITPSIRGY